MPEHFAMLPNCFRVLNNPWNSPLKETTFRCKTLWFTTLIPYMKTCSWLRTYPNRFKICFNFSLIKIHSTILCNHWYWTAKCIIVVLVIYETLVIVLNVIFKFYVCEYERNAIKTMYVLYRKKTKYSIIHMSSQNTLSKMYFFKSFPKGTKCSYS